MAKAMHSIFNLALAREVPFGIPQCSTYNAFFMDLPVPSFVFHFSLLTGKSIDSVVAHDGFFFVTENFPTGNYVILH